jgi:site-specific DNA-methyltransferase (adenine-specific)
MTGQAPFALRGRNPDVLTCIANLSNDEVFTPPEFANRMLDTLADGWAANNNGANIWADSSVKFLDPCTKSGVFLREITARLTQGLTNQIPNLEKRVNHILTNQVFGIGITYLTSLLARRTVYCSKFANGPHSVAASFGNENGNIWYERTEHTWVGTTESIKKENAPNGRCDYCGAPRAIFDRDATLENHAYAFIHTDDIKTRIGELFGEEMRFDVVIGNPPYQMTGGAGGSSDSSIYHLFVQQGLKLDPHYLMMVIPSRWLVGGRGMDEFRELMLAGKHISRFVDYTQMSTAFPGVDFEGGVGYFLWDREHQGTCEYTLYRGDECLPTVARDLSAHDIFVRDHDALSILEKVLTANANSIADILTNREPFKLESNFRSFRNSPRKGDVPLHYIDKGKRGVGYVTRRDLTKNPHLIDKWKVLVPKAYGERGAMPSMVLGRPLIAGPPSACTGSFLFFFADSEAEALSIRSYYATKFFRFLVSLRKITQDAFRPMYSWVPVQTWDREWTDAALYKRYRLTKEERAYIEKVIRPMDLSASDSDDA